MNRTYTRALYNLPPDTAESWLFESYEERLKIEIEWGKQGKKIKLHSAYKSLLHRILESELIDSTEQMLIRYPVIKDDEPQRFRLECYPLSDLFKGNVSFEGLEQSLEQGELPFYEVVTNTKTQRFSIPVRWVTNLSQKRQLVACGWVINQQGEGQYLATEFDEIYNDACQYLYNIPLGPINGEHLKGPIFKCLTLRIGLPSQDLKLPVGEESISLIEAMHEDIYFSAIEIFQHRLGLPAFDRSLMIGQVIPEVFSAIQPFLTIKRQSYSPEKLDKTPLKVSLGNAEHWLTPYQISEQLMQLEGKPFEVLSRQGNRVEGCAVLQDSSVKLAISGGQHANESSGIVGAIRAAHALKAQGDVDFTVCPLENPDGYALFRRLCQSNPNHMHHAARYTSAGNDLTHGKTYESLIRDTAKHYLLADVHVNLHGYPSHEWTRPLSGYVPEGFATWTIPKGFFIICRYSPGFKSRAETLLHAAINAVAGFGLQRQQNQQMLRRFSNIVEGGGFKISQASVPFVINEYYETDYPIEIITEAPDETVYGEAFRIAHESHYRVILAISNALKETT